MPTKPSADLSGFDDYRYWKPEYQAKALEQIRAAEQGSWNPFFCPIKTCNGHPHCLPVETRECPNPTGHRWEKMGQSWTCADCLVGGEPFDAWLWEHARLDQRPPKWTDPWNTLLLSGGRGSGKTRTGSEITHQATKVVPRMALVAATGPDLRETMIEGRSGLIATAKPGQRPVWEPSRKRLVWPNGCVAQGFSGEEPDRLRGPENGYAWVDEPAHFPLIEDVWSMLDFNLRIKVPGGVKTIATSTPKPSKWLKKLIGNTKTITHRVSTYANAHNLDPAFREKLIDNYEGTRLGRQELHGELLEDVEGALWSYDDIHWIKEHPDLVRIVVSVDPAGSVDKRADETGIIILGIGADKKIYVLADYTGKYTPDQWGREVWKAVATWDADMIVAEKNYGGLMVKKVVESSQPKHVSARLKLVDSRRGKAIRAEPIVALYEQGKVLHVGKRGDLHDLEEEQTNWVPGEGASPNRVDALVHGCTELYRAGKPASISSPTRLPSIPLAPRRLRAV